MRELSCLLNLPVNSIGMRQRESSHPVGDADAPPPTFDATTDLEQDIMGVAQEEREQLEAELERVKQRLGDRTERYEEWTTELRAQLRDVEHELERLTQTSEKLPETLERKKTIEQALDANKTPLPKHATSWLIAAMISSGNCGSGRLLKTCCKTGSNPVSGAYKYWFFDT